MAAIKRKQAEWMAQFLEVDLEIVLQALDEVSDEGQAGAEEPDSDEPDTEEADSGEGGTDEGDEAAQPEDAPEDVDSEPEAQADESKGGARAEAGDEPAAKAPAGAEKGFADPMPVASPAIPVILVIEGVKYLTRELVATVTVTNHTEQTLTLDKGAQMAHGALTKKPKLSLAPNESDTFTAHSVSLLSALDGIPVIEWLGKALDKLIGSPSLAGVEGTLKYLVGDDGTSWTCHFLYPRMITSSKEGTGTVAGQNPNGAKDNSTPPGSDDKWAFDLSGKGGGGGGGQAAGAVTVRVAIVNSSDQTIFLRHQENPGGEFMTNPKPKLGPGEQDSFMYGAAASDKTRACRGKLYYDVGDPKLVEWELMWDNPVTQKNISASFLNPKDQKTGLHTLDQIDNGDENVPATFTLSGKGGGTVPPGQGGAYAVTIDNKTDAELTLTNSNVTGGALVPTLPAKLAAGAAAQMQFTPDPAAKSGVFSAIWSVGQSGTGWHIKGTVPAGGDPVVDEAALDPANPKLSCAGKAAKTGDGGTFIFDLSGTAGPNEKPDDKFVPPPKGKQPTLRKDDDSPDGWVEYAQQLINGYKLGPELKVDGHFSAEMETFLKKVVQPRFGCLPDGVIGNETWSALREGPREKVGTDGRKPHSFEEKGPQARFATEVSDCVFYTAASDSLAVVVVSTGEQPIDTFTATVKLTQPSGTSHTHAIAIGKPYKKSPDGQGDLHAVQFFKATEVFELETGITPDMCAIDAYLDGEIGGDRLTVPPKIKPK